MNVRIVITDGPINVATYNGPIPKESDLYQINGVNKAIQQITHVINTHKKRIEGTDEFETVAEFVGVEVELC